MHLTRATLNVVSGAGRHQPKEKGGMSGWELHRASWKRLLGAIPWRAGQCLDHRGGLVGDRPVLQARVGTVQSPPIVRGGAGNVCETSVELGRLTRKGVRAPRRRSSPLQWGSWFGREPKVILSKAIHRQRRPLKGRWLRAEGHLVEGNPQATKPPQWALVASRRSSWAKAIRR